MSDWKTTDKPAEVSVKTSTEFYIPIPRYSGAALAIFGRHTGTGAAGYTFEASVQNMVPYNGTKRIEGFSDLAASQLTPLARIFSRQRSGEVDGDITDPAGVDGVEKTFCYIIWINHDWRQYSDPKMYFRHLQNAALTAFSGVFYVAVLPADVLKSEIWQYHSHDSLKTHTVELVGDYMVEELFAMVENTKGGTNLLTYGMEGKDGQMDIDVTSSWDALPHCAAFLKRYYTGATLDEDNYYFADLMTMPHPDRKLSGLFTAVCTATYYVVGTKSVSVALTEKDAGARARGRGATQVESISKVRPISMPEWPTPTRIRTGSSRSLKPGRIF